MSDLDAVLFDLGGTLDGSAGWRQRFHRLFGDCGLGEAFSFDQRTRAFDFAETRSHAAADMSGTGLRELVRLHVGWQFESLRAPNHTAAATIVDRFVRDVDRAVRVSRGVLAVLAGEGYRLGVVSNGCGNVSTLCAEYGLAPMLSVIVDSHVFGRSKPDPAIFRHALDRIGVDASRTAFVGDSLDRDIEPAKALGMRTFWLHDPRGDDVAAAGKADVVDVLLGDLDQLPQSLVRVVR